ncbi:MAG: hypothetical protein ACLUR5_05065 [Eubacterium ventriosum]
MALQLNLQSIRRVIYENARVNSCYLDGYTGDKHCTVCNMQLQQGEVIPKFEHEYENDVCKNCGRIMNS